MYIFTWIVLLPSVEGAEQMHSMLFRLLVTFTYGLVALRHGLFTKHVFTCTIRVQAKEWTKSSVHISSFVN